jgi:hypothetical protein
MQQRLIPNEHCAGCAQSLAKAYPRRQDAIDPCGAAIGTNTERFLQPWNEILCFTENEARREKDCGIVMDMLKDFVDDASFIEVRPVGRKEAEASGETAQPKAV